MGVITLKLTNITATGIKVAIGKPDTYEYLGRTIRSAPPMKIVPAGLFNKINVHFDDVHEFIEYNRNILDRGLIRLSDEDTAGEEEKLTEFAWKTQHNKNIKAKEELNGKTDASKALDGIKDTNNNIKADVNVELDAFGKPTKEDGKSK